jgi:dipeptidyl aminopeptidase/acylaminoacyl peptidase
MSDSPMPGLWKSPITPRSLAGSLRLSEPCWDSDGRTLAWVEGRSDRGVIVVQEDGGAVRDLTPAWLSVRAFVGYGGGDFTLSHGAAYFVGQADQRIYRQELASGQPRPITPAFGAAASPAVSPDGRWLVYVHSYEDRDCLAIVDAAGAGWPRKLAEGRDFYMQPAWHPDGTQLAWVEWDHPNMPWDGTELALATLTSGEDDVPTLCRKEIAAGRGAVAVLQPEFDGDGSGLLFISDESGIGHVYRRHLVSGQTVRLTSGDGDFGRPAWAQGQRIMAPDARGVLAVRRVRGFDSLELFSGNASLSSPVPGLDNYANFSGLAASGEGRCACVAAGPTQPPRIVVIGAPSTTVDDARTSLPVTVARRSDNELVPASALSHPEPVTWISFDGGEAHGLYYPPAAPEGRRPPSPPLVVLVHGGPTGQAAAGWDAPAQFLATRGYAVFYPNYRGSTGYGREYMQKLRGKWGVYDVQDAKSGAEALADRGLADRDRLVIMGGSAGGYTVLQSLVDLPSLYRAAICMFGISNQFTLASDTHKFESRYSEALLGALPESAAAYRDRSPVFHADRIVDPVAVFQGDIDRVVPRQQSDAIVASLRARGVPHEYHVYEGEGHGWRKAETIERFYASVDTFLREHVLFA